MNDPYHRTSRRDHRRRLLAALCTSAVLASLAQAQTASSTASATTEPEQTVNLPQFEITEKPANPYQSQQALSSSRIAMQIQDVPQTISVVSGEFMHDAMGFRMLDAAKYVTPIVESTLPFGGDRYQIRGFQVSQEFIDGSVISGADGYSMSLAPYNVERIEVLKGPNAILVPGGSPGGVMNPITKSPLWVDKSSVMLELAEYYGNAISTDLNRVLNAKGTIAARLVAAYWRNEGYIKNNYRNGWMIAPSVSFKLSPAHTLVLKSEFVLNRELNLGGLPIDPSIGSNGYARIATGLPRNWSFGDDSDSRRRETQRLSGELLSTWGDHVTSRLYVMGDHVIRDDEGATNAGLTNAGGGSRNPYTGLYEPGVNWNSTTLASTSAPITPWPTWVYTRNAGAVYLEYTEAHIKNDYAIRFEQPWFKSTSIVGFAGNYSKVHFKSRPAAPRPSVYAYALDSILYPPYAWPAITPGGPANGTDKTAKQNDWQFFAYETFSVLQERLQLSGGISRFSGDLKRVDTTGTAIDPVLGTKYPKYSLTDTAKSLGVVVKPVKSVSLFYGYNESGGTMPGSLSAGNNLPTLRVAEGNQNEYGVKTTQLNGALTASFSYFDIVQKNYPTTNSEYYKLVAEGKFDEAAKLPSSLYLDLNSSGWEFELTYAVNKNLTLLGNYTKFKMRQPITETRVRGTPDQAGAAYADYRFAEGLLKGFGVNVGVDYKSDVAGDNASGFTTTAPINGEFIPARPTFLVAGRILWNLGFSYKAKDWKAQIQISNLFDKDYILAAGSRSALIVGDPRAVKGSITYSF